MSVVDFLSGRTMIAPRTVFGVGAAICAVISLAMLGVWCVARRRADTLSA
jgi:hypothetical protein